MSPGPDPPSEPPDAPDQPEPSSDLARAKRLDAYADELLDPDAIRTYRKLADDLRRIARDADDEADDR